MFKNYRHTFFQQKKKMRALWSQSDFDVFFSKLFLIFQFWTFLKMSIFNSGPDFFSKIFKQYILFLKALKDSLNYFLNILFINRSIYKIIISSHIRYDTI
jgi:hypothetical protein